MKKITYIASNENENFIFKNTFTYIASNPEENSYINYNFKDKNAAKNIFLPTNIFNNGLSGLEAISKYLKENSRLRYCEIAKLINRDDRTIWDAYQNARRKSNEDFSNEASKIQIPIEIFNSRPLSILETLTVYLKEELNLRYCQIASLLNKNDRTIWTVYNRATKKKKNGKNS
jgi:hypothetical protein